MLNNPESKGNILMLSHLSGLRYTNPIVFRLLIKYLTIKGSPVTGDGCLAQYTNY